MKGIQQKFRILLALLIVSFAYTSCSSDDDNTSEDVGPIVESLFKNNAEGWKIVGDAQGGYVEPTYSPDGGVTGGYIYADDDVAGGVWFFAAPSAYQGNKLEYYGATLSFNLFQESNMSNQFEAADVIFRNGDKQVTYKHNSSNYPGSDWTSYAMKINANQGWLKGDYDSSVSATEADIKEVLSNVTAFWIRGEFETGPDSGGLDKVVIE